MKVRFLLLSALVLITFLPLQAQSSVGAQIKNYLPGDGLSAKQVNAIRADGQGMLWIATTNGLNRFDGRDFVCWTSREGLRSNGLRQLHLDGNRFLWLVYEQKNKNAQKGGLQLDVFDRIEGRVVPIGNSLQVPLPFEIDQLDTFFIKDNTLVFGVSNSGWYLFEHGKGFRHLKHLAANEHWLAIRPQEIVTLSHEAGQYSINLRKPSGLIRQRIRFPERYIGQPHLLQSEGDVLTWLLRTAGDTTQLHWVQTDLQSGLFSTCMTVSVPAALANPQDWLYVEALDAYWTGCGTQGLLVNQDGEVIYQIDIAQGKMMNEGRQHCLLGNTLWQCSDEGFYQFGFFTNRFRYVLADLWPAWNCRSIAKWKDNYLFSSPAGSLLMKDLDTGDYERVARHGISSVVDKYGRWWMTAAQELIAYDIEEERLQTYELTTMNEAWSLYMDYTGNLWMSQKGLFKYDPGKQQQESVNYGDYKVLQNHTVYYFHTITPDSLLLLTTAGVFGFSPQRGILSRYWSGGAGEYYLPSNDFRHLYYDEATGIYWLATGDKGLLRWDPQTGERRIFYFDKSLVSMVHAVYADAHGHLWMSTEGGIVQFDKESHQYKIYTTRDGLLSDEFNRISHFQDDDGKLIFGSINGVLIIDPSLFRDELKKKYAVRPMVVELMKYDNNSDRLENRTEELMQTGSIDMYPDERFISLRLALQDARWNNRDTRFYYRISGLDEEWIAVDGNQLTLNKLPYGNQLLQIKAQLSNGRASQSILHIPIQVYRPFYLTVWFVLACVAVLGGIFYLFYRLQIRNIRHQQRLRTQIAADLYEDVGAMLSRMAMQAEMANYAKPDRTKPILEDILNTSRVTLDTMRDLIWSIDARYDTCSDMLLRMEEQLEEVLTPAGIGYSFDTKNAKPEQLISPQLRREVFFIFKEALDNAVKIGKPASLTIFFSYTGTHLQMIMEECHPPQSILTEQLQADSKAAFQRAMQRAERLQASLHIEVTQQGYRLKLVKK